MTGNTCMCWITAARMRWSEFESETTRRNKSCDLKSLATTGRYGGCLSLAPDDSPLLLRDTGTQDVYSVDWEAP